jgi:hypothetical protein
VDGIHLGAEIGGVGKEVATAIKSGKTPGIAWLLGLRKPVDEMFGGFSHDLGKGPILLLCDEFEPLVKRVWELNLSSCHDVLSTLVAI